MLPTLLSKSLHDASFLWSFLSRQPPTIEFKFKDFKTFEYYGIRIETFELTTVEYRRMKKLDSETKITITKLHELHDEKYVPRDPKSCLM